uniref:WGS project CAEQ00000000 data, annotated contig 1735 n=1 Tax=Trypanosoma congolense (strain IL3000) TaxID=1068625 RepID=F9W8H7_TRYCI|nr:unnamed protein product [Trypanosoma congolense IL3000]
MELVPQDVIDAIAKCSAEVQRIQSQTDNALVGIRAEFRERIEVLFEKRQEQLGKVDGFWSEAFTAPESPVRSLLCGPLDQRLARALTDFNVKTSIREGTICRCVMVTFRSNICVEEGTYSRELDSTLKTISVKPIVWKNGTERTRHDSVFKFFSTDETNEEFIEDVLAAFDELFQNPFLVLEAETE